MAGFIRHHVLVKCALFPTHLFHTTFLHIAMNTKHTPLIRFEHILFACLFPYFTSNIRFIAAEYTISL